MPELERLGLDMLGEYCGEWNAVIGSHANLLLEAPEQKTRTAVALLTPHLDGPTVCHLNGPQARDLPTGDVSGLILHDVDALTRDQQARLLQWIDGAPSRTQIVSTSESPLFFRVSGGLFSEALYYRLNVVLLRQR
jgi:hypothetical protein